MPEMKNLNNVGILVDAVVNQNRCVDKLPNVSASSHGAADVWKTLEQLNVVQYSVAKTFSSRRKVGPRVGENFLKLC